jgi:mannitol/fructose-specific phosphotransferase system IIA component (Ntr-type)
MTTVFGVTVLEASLYIPDIKTRRKLSALQELVSRASLAGVVREPSLLRETLLLRERLGSSAVGKGVAVPHARSIAVVEPRVVVARSKRGVDWGAVDGQDVQIVLLVLSPAESPVEAHIEAVARAASAVRLQRSRQRVLDAEGFDEVCAALGELSP